MTYSVTATVVHVCLAPDAVQTRSLRPPADCAGNQKTESVTSTRAPQVGIEQLLVHA